VPLLPHLVPLLLLESYPPSEVSSLTTCKSSSSPAASTSSSRPKLFSS
jgi:hypothetical protein